MSVQPPDRPGRPGRTTHSFPHVTGGSLRAAPDTPREPVDVQLQVENAAETAATIVRAVEQVIEGKTDVVRLALAVLLAEGHLLIEDVPGVGKTMLAKALARSDRLLGAAHPVHARPAAQRRHRREHLQPGAASEFEFKPGRGLRQHRGRRRDQPRLARRPSRRCSSAWRSGRSPSTARPTSSPPPFMVIATQNPIEMEGTYPLPEAQRDRFTARVSMGYPTRAAELAMLDSHGGTRPAGRRCEPVADAATRSQADRGRPAGARRRRGPAATSSTWSPPPAAPRAAARRLAARRPAPAARRPRGGGARGPRLRRARRRPGRSRCRCSPTGCCRPPRRRSPGAPPRTSSPRLVAPVPLPRARQRSAGRHRRLGPARPSRAVRAAGGARPSAALAGLTTRGRCLLAAGADAAASPPSLARPAGPAAGRRCCCVALPLVAAPCVGAHPVPAGLRPHGSTRAGVAGRRRRAGRLRAGQHLPAAHRRAAAGGHAAVRAGRPAAVRAGPGAAARPAHGALPVRSDVRGALPDRARWPSG